MSFSAMKNFNVSRKIFFACFSIISDANNRDKLKKSDKSSELREKRRNLLKQI